MRCAALHTLFVVSFAIPSAPALAQSAAPYPVKPIRLVVPYVSELWWGLAAPGKTPPEIVERLSDTLRKAMQTPQLKQRYATEGAEPVPMTPQEFTKYVHGEIARWRQVVKDAGLKLE